MGIRGGGIVVGGGGLRKGEVTQDQKILTLENILLVLPWKREGKEMGEILFGRVKGGRRQ